MPKKMKTNVNMDKIIIMTVVVNTLQILAALALVVATVFAYESVHQIIIQVGMGLMSLVVCWGAGIDIREAILARRISHEADMLEESHRYLEELNTEMRKQRHDFMNHLQVVYSLVELGDSAETMQYIERVYGDLKRVGKVLKTTVPAINALIAAKQNDAEAAGIRMETEVHTALDGMKVEGWELCRVLGNLLDNAFDALNGVEGAEVKLSLTEDLNSFEFRVFNNGPMIPEKIRERIFEARFSTKGSERGMGLSIVNDIVTRYNGSIKLESDKVGTVFSVYFPKTRTIEEKEA